MANQIIVDKEKVTTLFDKIRAKAGVSGNKTFDEMNDVVDRISSGVTPTGTKEINASNAATYDTLVDVTNYANVVVKGSPFDTINLDFGDKSFMSYDVKPFFMRQVDIIKPSTLIASNIKKGVTIAGITGTLDSTKPTLNAPTITLSDNTLTITDSNNGNFADSYAVYKDGVLLTTITTKTLDLSTLITEGGTYAITVKAKGTNFNDSVSSNSVSYIVSSVITCTISSIPTNAYGGSNGIYVTHNDTTYASTPVSFEVNAGDIIKLINETAYYQDGVKVNGSVVLNNLGPYETYDFTVPSGVTSINISADGYYWSITY